MGNITRIFMNYRYIFYPAFILFLLPSCAKKVTQTGKASYYADSLNGNKTANGERFHNSKKTAAHKTIPFGTKVKVTNPETHRSVKVKITDRGPFAPGRVIDLSYKAARKMDMLKAGVIPVKIKVIGD